MSVGNVCVCVCVCGAFTLAQYHTPLNHIDLKEIPWNIEVHFMQPPGATLCLRHENTLLGQEKDFLAYKMPVLVDTHTYRQTLTSFEK